ncbi:MAG TPA: hypothetical protein VG347_03800 [Verrucomicrobiae bacterium]|nr:hypothetical protein [Verrucomicrobiae bacterium]
MPPSGFYKKHSQPLAGFFRACVEDLVSESKGVRTPALAIQRELRHIQMDSASTTRGPIPTKILELTQKFYEDLLAKGSTDFERLEQDSEELIGSIERDIEAIKVADVV